MQAAIARGLAIEVFGTEAAAGRHAACSPYPVHLVTERAAPKRRWRHRDSGGSGGGVRGAGGCVAGRPDLVAVAVGVSEPGNAGHRDGIADAMGADAVILAGHAVDLQREMSARVGRQHLPPARHRRTRRRRRRDARAAPG